jgi:hypothetical protein
VGCKNDPHLAVILAKPTRQCCYTIISNNFVADKGLSVAIMINSKVEDKLKRNMAERNKGDNVSILFCVIFFFFFCLKLVNICCKDTCQFSMPEACCIS